MKRFLQQHGRSDLLILRAPSVTDEQLEEYAKESTNYQNVQKWAFCARVTSVNLERYVYSHLSTQTSTLLILDLSCNTINGRFSKNCPLCRQNLGVFSFFADFSSGPKGTTDGREEQNFLCDVHKLTETLRIRHNTSLEVLKLRDNPIGSVGSLQLMTEIAHAENSRIAVLDLSNCRIDDRAAVPLNSLLKGLPAHRKFFIKLNKNRMGCLGTREISKGLPSNVSITLTKNYPRRPKSSRQPMPPTT